MSDKFVKWIKQQVQNAGAKGCVFGLSGGLDSSVVGALCQLAFPKNCLGLIMPCQSQAEDLKHALAVATKFQIPTKLVDLEPSFNQLFVQLEGKSYDKQETNLAIANIKPRLRMIGLYYHANQKNYLVVGTGNKSEAAMGYSTKYGDAGVDILPLANMLKSQVRELAVGLGVPESIIKKPPSAGLWPGQTDEAEMGISYEELDKIITGLEKNDLKGLDPQLVKLVKNKLETTEHKRKLPPCF